MVLTNIKTPGVYVDEIALLPPSVAQVATAIPAFVGYTFKAKTVEGEAIKEPVKISSLVEFTLLFGSGYTPETYAVRVDAGTKEIKSTNPSKRFYLYDAIRQFFDNGGGDCYIVSVGGFTSIAFADLSKGIAQLKKFDEPTLILFPDAVGLIGGDNKPDYSSMANLQQQALALCADLMDRFAILDLMDGNLKEDVSNKPIEKFRSNIGINNLKYGAAYYPWLISDYEIPVSMQQLEIKDATDTVITDFIPFSRNKSEEDLLAGFNQHRSIVQAFSETIFSDPADQKKLLLNGVSFLNDRLLLLEKEVRNSDNTNYTQKFADWMDFAARLVAAFPAVKAMPALASPAVQKILEEYKQNQAFMKAIQLLIALEKLDKVKDNTIPARNDAFLKDTAYKDVAPDWTGGVDFATLDLNTVAPGYDIAAYTKDKAGALKILGDVKEKIIPALTAAYENTFFLQSQSEKTLFSNHTFFKGMVEKIKETMRTLPPSGAIAGVYAAIDRTRGVWKAPANVSLSSVIGPSVKLDNKEQEDLNVHTSGKSINAIRTFTGKGVLVWGARTLAGNDNEWRYISVRRFFNMVEESVKKASEPFVFEPNDANTWIKVKVMIENFLTLQWRAGALQGAKAEEAFFVSVGLGETMTEVDILEGKMIVEIGMAAVRPAEFIILRFSHKMMEQ